MVTSWLLQLQSSSVCSRKEDGVKGRRESLVFADDFSTDNSLSSSFPHAGGCCEHLDPSRLSGSMRQVLSTRGERKLLPHLGKGIARTWPDGRDFAFVLTVPVWHAAVRQIGLVLGQLFRFVMLFVFSTFYLCINFLKQIWFSLSIRCVFFLVIFFHIFYCNYNFIYLPCICLGMINSFLL